MQRDEIRIVSAYDDNNGTKIESAYDCYSMKLKCP